MNEREGGEGRYTRALSPLSPLAAGRSCAIDQERARGSKCVSLRSKQWQYFLAKELHRALDLLRRHLADVDVEEQVSDTSLPQSRNLPCHALWRAGQEGMLDHLVGTRRCLGLSGWEAPGVIPPTCLVEVVAVALQRLGGHIERLFIAVRHV